MDWNFAGTIVAPIVQAAAATAGVIGLVFVWIQIRETRNQLSLARDQLKLSVDHLALTVDQMKQQTMWNQVHAQHTLLSVLPSADAERELWKVVGKYRAAPSWQFPHDACARLYDEIDDWMTIKGFITCFERLCAAISANSLDDGYAYSVHGARVIDTFNTFEHYINYIRRKRSNATIYLELEKVATRWAQKAKSEQAAIESEQANLHQARCMQKTVG